MAKKITLEQKDFSKAAFDFIMSTGTTIPLSKIVKESPFDISKGDLLLLCNRETTESRKVIVTKTYDVPVPAIEVAITYQ